MFWVSQAPADVPLALVLEEYARVVRDRLPARATATAAATRRTALGWRALQRRVLPLHGLARTRTRAGRSARQQAAHERAVACVERYRARLSERRALEERHDGQLPHLEHLLAGGAGGAGDAPAGAGDGGGADADAPMPVAAAAPAVPLAPAPVAVGAGAGAGAAPPPLGAGDVMEDEGNGDADEEDDGAGAGAPAAAPVAAPAPAAAGAGAGAGAARQSQYAGVRWVAAPAGGDAPAAAGAWIAEIEYGGATHQIGRFAYEADAAQAYDAAARLHLVRSVNFPVPGSGERQAWVPPGAGAGPVDPAMEFWEVPPMTTLGELRDWGPILIDLYNGEEAEEEEGGGGDDGGAAAGLGAGAMDVELQQ